MDGVVINNALDSPQGLLVLEDDEGLIVSTAGVRALLLSGDEVPDLRGIEDEIWGNIECRGPVTGGGDGWVARHDTIGVDRVKWEPKVRGPKVAGNTKPLLGPAI